MKIHLLRLLFPEYRLLLLLIPVLLFGQHAGGQVTGKPVKPKTAAQPPPPPPGNRKTPTKTPAASPPDLSYLVPLLQLKPEADPYKKYKPEHYFLESVTDSTGTDSLGFAILPRDYRKQKIAFDGPMAVAFEKYLHSIIRKDSSLLPVRICIRRFRIEEVQKTKADLDATVDVKLEVYCKPPGKDWIYLEDFGGKLKNEIYVGFKREYDRVLAQNLQELPEMIENVVTLAREIHPAFIREVKLLPSLREMTGDTEAGDTLFIDNHLRLEWSDFRGTAMDPEAAYMVADLTINDDIQLRENKLEVRLLIQPYIVRKKSWAGSKAKSNRLLNHQYYETRLIYQYALTLQQNLQQLVVTPEDFSEKMQQAYLALQEKLSEERQRYYFSTKGGENVKAQAEWEDKIESAIQALLNKLP
ncbi:MAG: hypothetical protein IAE96_10885 [Chitinophagaceae bacterium]|nr:hypothetical protein [Chitinophagaceae bacterium]